MAFGNPDEPHHAAALAIVAETEAAAAEILARQPGVDAGEAATLARVISAIQFVTLTSAEHLDSSIDEIVDAVRSQVAVILPR